MSERIKPHTLNLGFNKNQEIFNDSTFYKNNDEIIAFYILYHFTYYHIISFYIQTKKHLLIKYIVPIVLTTVFLLSIKFVGAIFVETSYFLVGRMSWGNFQPTVQPNVLSFILSEEQMKVWKIRWVLGGFCISILETSARSVL